VGNESKRLFFAVNLSNEVKQEIAKNVLPEIPKNRWSRVSKENLHVTMHFLGHLPKESIKRLREQVEVLQKFDCFEAEINCAGHFKGKILWLGFGKGTEEFNLLNRKLQKAIGTHDDRFHAHITLARNKGAEKKQAQEIVGKIGKLFKRKIQVKSIELIESKLESKGPKYSVLFSVIFCQNGQQPV